MSRHPRLSRPTRLAASLVLATAVGAGSVAALLGAGSAAASPRPTVPTTARFSGAFTFHGCPAGSAAGDFCLTDRLTGSITGIGAVTGTFEVDIAFASTDSNGCAPITKSGSFTGPDGSTLRVRADGFYCGSTQIADYRYTTQGGTGRLRDVHSSGLWLVPAPETSTNTGGTGAEFLSPFQAD
jgi:hypothetical protein